MLQEELQLQSGHLESGYHGDRDDSRGTTLLERDAPPCPLPNRHERETRHQGLGEAVTRSPEFPRKVLGS